MSYIMVDVESDGSIPGDYSMICFGAVVVEPSLSKTFHGKLKPISEQWIPEALAVSGFTREETLQFDEPKTVMEKFSLWIADNSKGRPFFISDNNGFDWQFINWYFHHFTGNSGGTMLALAADEIIMDENAVLGPVDPQLGNMAAASVLQVMKQKPIEEIDDQTIIMADLSQKAIAQVQRFVRTLLKDEIPKPKIAPENIEGIIDLLTTGKITHDCPITVEEASKIGLPITVGLPTFIYKLMELYPQPSGGRPSVQYIPMPYKPYPSLPETKGRPMPDSRS